MLQYQLQQENSNNGDVNNEFVAGNKIVLNQSPSNDTSSSSIVSKKVMYFLGAQPISGNKEKNIWEYVFVNPNNIPLTNVSFSIGFEKAIDTSYLERSISVKNGLFETNTVRDAFCSLLPDKLKIIFSASYVGANNQVKIIVIKRGNSKVRLDGVGKFF